VARDHRTIAQYAGRLHPLFDGKREVRVYDYADLNVPMLARMFDRRCRGYEAVGYTMLLPASVRRLETLPETKGRFRLNVGLPIAFHGVGQLEVDLLCAERRPPPRPSPTGVARAGPQEAEHRAKEDGDNRSAQVVVPRQLVPNAVRQAQDPLPYGRVGEYGIDQMGGPLGHPDGSSGARAPGLCLGSRTKPR